MRLVHFGALLIAVIFAEVGGCSFSISSNSTQASQYSGSYTLLAQNCYSYVSNGNYFIDIDDLDATGVGSPPVPQLQSTFSQLNSSWTLKNFVSDDFPTYSCPNQSGRNVQASDFLTAPTISSDFLWYTGHGGGGEVALYDSNPTPGGGLTGTPGGTSTFGGNVQNVAASWSFGAPYIYTNPPPGFGAGLKWVFLNSSQSVKDDANDTSWVSAFNTSANGIHGVYGFEGEPTTNSDVALETSFLDGAVTVPAGAPNPLNVRTAWIDAAMSDSSGMYGVYELSNSGYDVLSGPAQSGAPPYSTESELSGSDSLNYYDAANPQGIVVFSPLQPLSTVSTGAYNPSVLQPESHPDSTLSSLSDQYSSAYGKVQVNANEFKIATAAYVGVHYETSGGVKMEMPLSSIAMSSTESSAQSFATSTVSSYAGGLPSDAVLSEVLTHRKINSAGTQTLGYSFIWRHSNGTVGGDKIILTVDNVSQRTCLSYTLVNNPPLHPVEVCTKYQTTYPMRASYVYRMWRTQVASSRRYPQQYNADPSSSALWNVVESNPGIKGQLASLGTVLGYTNGYWTPPMSSTDNSAYSAIHFYMTSGAVVTADAYSGAVYAVSQ